MPNIDKILNTKNNKNLYNRLIEGLLKKETLYIATNEYNNISNPVIIPILDTKLVAIQIFSSFEIANEYKTLNPIEFSEIKINDLLLILDKLFFKGVTGALYFSDNEVVTSYLNIEDLLKENKLATKENKEVIRVLNNVLLNKKYFNYLHHKTLTIDEILYYIVRFNIHNEGTKKYVNIFENENLAEEYCTRNGIYGNDKDAYPITTISNSVLYHCITKLKNKADFIVIHTQNKKYRINIDDFIYLIINVGFEQLNLD